MAAPAIPPDRELAQCVADALDSAGIESPQAIYVFGSAAGGREHARSDVDLAFLATRPQDPVTVFDAAQVLATKLGRDVDLIDLRRASTVMRMQVIASGRRLAVSDVVATDTFEMYAYSGYARLQEERAEAVRAFEAAYDD